MKTKNICLAAALAAMSANLNAQVIINVDAQKKGPEVSATHYGMRISIMLLMADSMPNSYATARLKTT